MSSEDQFTSVQWDRDEVDGHTDTVRDNIDRNNDITEEIDEGNDSELPSYSAETPPTDHIIEQTEETKDSVDDDHVQENASNELKKQESGAQEELASNVATSRKPSVVSQESAKDTTDISSPLNTSDQPNSANSSIKSHQNHTTSPPQPALHEPPTLSTPPEYTKYVLKANVTAPIRDLDTNSKPFISYLVTTTTDNPSVLKLSSHKNESEQVEIKVRRRYGDFRILHDCLNNDYPMLLIPPLPSKSSFKYLTGDTFSTEFVHKRLHSLDRFVSFILQHKHLSQSSIFHLFLSDSNDWITFTKNLKISYKDTDDNSPNGSNGGFVNKVVNEDLITETVMNFLTPSKHKRETNKEILEINDKLKKLYENLLKLDKIFVKLNKKNHDLSVDYEQFSTQITKLSIVQQADADSQDAATESPDDNIMNNFKIFSSSLDYFSKSWSELHQFIDESFLVALKDCSKYIASFTNLIELQHNKKIDLQVLQDYLNKTRNELSNLHGSSDSNRGAGHHPPPNPVLNGASSGGIVNNTTQLIKDTLSTSATTHIGSSVTDQKIQKLNQKVSQLENEISVQTRVVNDLTNKIINEEYPNWDKFNRNELKESMLGLCNQEINFYKGLVNNWSEVEQKLTQRLEDLK